MSASLTRKKGVSYFVLPEQCFPLALPEFHVLCASGAVGEDKGALDTALSKLSTVSEQKEGVREGSQEGVQAAARAGGLNVTVLKKTLWNAYMVAFFREKWAR